MNRNSLWSIRMVMCVTAAIRKKVKGEFGEIEVAVPRDRDSSFEPVILPKGQSRFTGFDDKIISLYARDDDS